MLIYFPWEVSDYRDCFFVYLRSRPDSAAPLTVWTLRQGSDGATCCLSTSRGGCWVHAVSLDHKQQHGALPPPPSLIVSDIDLMGWGTAAVLWNWMLLSLQQQDLMTLSDERELWDVVGYLDDLFLEIDI